MVKLAATSQRSNANDPALLLSAVNRILYDDFSRVDMFATALVAFNVGVELGQLSIILTMYLLVARTMSSYPWYRRRVVIPCSLLIAAVALYWTIQRIFFPS